MREMRQPNGGEDWALWEVFGLFRLPGVQNH
jgi:hypothetical protein